MASPPILPAHIDESLLVPDPSRRAGVWYHEPTDDVIAMPLDWKPNGQNGRPVPVPSVPVASTISIAEADTTGGDGIAAFGTLTPSKLDKMNRGQMAQVATAFGITNFDSMTKNDCITVILAKQAEQKLPQEANTAPEQSTGDTPGDPWVTDLTGKDVVVLQGTLSGKLGVISEMGGEEDDFAVRVLIDGNEVTFAAFEPDLRFATADEIAAALEAAKQ